MHMQTHTHTQHRFKITLIGLVLKDMTIFILRLFVACICICIHFFGIENTKNGLNAVNIVRSFVRIVLFIFRSSLFRC